MLIMAINSIFFSCPGDKTFSGVIESLTNIIEPGAVVTFGLLNISSMMMITDNNPPQHTMTSLIG